MTRTFTTDQPRELLAALRFSALHAEAAAAGEADAWRWLSVGLVLALQNACLCALDVGDPEGRSSLRRADFGRARLRSRRGPEAEESRAEERRADEGEARAPGEQRAAPPRILSVLELLERAADPRFLPPPFQLPLSPAARDDLNALVDLRNTFLHFSQDGWSLDLETCPPLMLGACAALRHLAVTQPAWTPLAADRAEAADLLARIDAAMEHYADGA